MASRFSGGGGGSLGNARGTIDLDASGAIDSLRSFGSSMGKLQGSFGGISSGIQSIGSNAASVARSVGGLQTALLGVATAAAGKITSDATIKAAGDLEQSVANIKSIKGDLDSSQVFKTLTTLSTRIPQTATQLADGLYNIFSSIDISFEGAVTLLEQFGKGATAAQTDAQSFGTAIIGVMNAYKLSTADAAHVQDVFFNTVKNGVVTGKELAVNLGVVTQGAKAAGLTVDELGAAIAGVTKEGGPAAQNINNLANVFNKIVTKDSQKAMAQLGVQFAKSDGTIRPFFDVIGDLKAALDKLSPSAKALALQDIFPDAQARQGILVLMSQLDNIRGFLEENKTAAGAASAAFTTMVSTFNNQAQILHNTVSAVLIDLGARSLPLATAAVVALTGVLQNVRAILPDLGTAAGQAFGRLASGAADIGTLEGVLNRLFGVGSPITGGILALLDALSQLRERGVSALLSLGGAAGTLVATLGNVGVGLGEIARQFAAQIFPPNAGKEIAVVGSGMEALRKQVELSRSPMERFQQVAADTIRAITGSKDVQALADAFGRLRDAALPLATAIAKLIAVFVGPFIPADAASGMDTLGTAADRLKTPAEAAAGVLATLRGAIAAVAGFVDSAAGGLERLATSLTTIGEKVAASGSIERLREALVGLGSTLATITAPLGAFFSQLANRAGASGAIGADREIRTVGQGMAALQKSAELGNLADAASAAAAISGAIDTLATAVTRLDGLITTAHTTVTQFYADLSATGALDTFRSGMETLAGAVVTLATAPWTGISGGITQIEGAAGQASNIQRFATLLSLMGKAASAVGAILDTVAATMERFAFVLGQQIDAAERLARGDVAGAVAALARSFDLIRTLKGPPLEADKLIDQQSFVEQKAIVQGVIDTLQTLSAAPDRTLRAQVAITADASQLDQVTRASQQQLATLAKPTPVRITADNLPLIEAAAAAMAAITRVAGQTATATISGNASGATTAAAEAEAALAGVPATTPTTITGDATGAVTAAADATAALAALPPETRVTIDAFVDTALAGIRSVIGLLDGVPRSFAVSASVDISGAESEIRRLGNMIPHSPAKEGPLSQVPDWNYLVANLPDALQSMIALVQHAGEQIGAGQQVEHFKSIADAITAAAGAVEATTRGLASTAAFVRPSAAILDDLAASMEDVIGRLRGLAGMINDKSAEAIKRLADTASSAMGALGASVEALGKVGTFTGPAIGRVADAVDHMAGLLARLRDLGQGFSPADLTHVSEVGRAASDAMAGLGAAIEPLTKAAAFVGPAVGNVEDVINHISGVMVRLGTLGKAFSGQEIRQAQDLGNAVKAAMEGLQAAVEALDLVRGFRGFDPGLFDGLFSLLSNVAVRFRDLSLAFGPQQAQQARDAAGVVKESFGALSEALAVIPKLAEARIPDVSGALADVQHIIAQALTGIDTIARQLGGEAIKRSGEFAESASRVVSLIGGGVDAFNKLADLQEVSDTQIARFGSGVTRAVEQLGQVAQAVGSTLTKEAISFSENAAKALQLLGAAASLQGLATFVAPSSRQFAAFFAALRVAVDGLVTEAQRVAPDIARRTGQVGEDLGKAFGALGTALTAFSALNEFQAGKGFDAKLNGVFHFMRLTIERMQALSASFGDLRGLTAFAATVEALSRALSSFAAAATAAGEAKGLDKLAALATSLAQTAGAIVARSEHQVIFSGGITVTVQGADGANHDTASQIADRVSDEIVAKSVAAVTAAVRDMVAA